MKSVFVVGDEFYVSRGRGDPECEKYSLLGARKTLALFSLIMKKEEKQRDFWSRHVHLLTKPHGLYLLKTRKLEEQEEMRSKQLWGAGAMQERTKSWFQNQVKSNPLGPELYTYKSDLCTQNWLNKERNNQ